MDMKFDSSEIFETNCEKKNDQSSADGFGGKILNHRKQSVD